MSCKDPAYKAYFRRSILFAVLYIAATAIATFLPIGLELGTPFAVALAILPALVLMFWIWAFGRMLFDLQDEYLRMLEVRKALIATGFALAIAGSWGMVELSTDVPKLPVFYIFPIWCVGLAVGEAYNRISGHGGTPL